MCRFKNTANAGGCTILHEEWTRHIFIYTIVSPLGIISSSLGQEYTCDSPARVYTQVNCFTHVFHSMSNTYFSVLFNSCWISSYYINKTIAQANSFTRADHYTWAYFSWPRLLQILLLMIFEMLGHKGTSTWRCTLQWYDISGNVHWFVN